MTLAALVLALVAMPPSDAAAASEPLLLDFQAEWCGPCREMKPEIEKLARAGYPIKKVDIDASPGLAKRYKIDGVPAFVVVDSDGNELARAVGYRPAAELAAMYRKVQAKLQAAENERRATTEENVPRARRTIPVSDRDPEDDADPAPRDKAPKPWETGVRIKIKLTAREMEFGSGTIIHSTADESIILTCAHIFKLVDRPTPTDPKKFPLRIEVDLFDGRLSDTHPRQVHFVETVQGEAIDYNLVNDVGLIRIRPGRRLPASPVVPPSWRPERGTKMVTVGCSEGHDATAWSTRIVRGDAGLQHRTNGKVVPFTVIECETAPKQGRSGGGLYTEEGFVAGVCDFADTQGNKGLYATPTSIHRLLDRNRMTALYKPDSGGGRLLADNAPTGDRAEPRRAQSPAESDRDAISLPEPKLMGIPEPTLASASSDAARPAEGSGGSRKWQTRAVPAGMIADPSPADLDERPAPDVDPEEGARPAFRPEAPPARVNGGKWRKITRVGGNP